MVTDLEFNTVLVVTVNVAVVAPAVTVTLAGTCAAALLLESDTAAPPAGAFPLSITVPVDEMPPCTLVGFSVTEANVAGFIFNVAICVAP